MAAVNPLEDILNSDVDESAITALVGSLESQIASQTSKLPDPINFNSLPSQNNGIQLQSQNVNSVDRLNSQPVQTLVENVQKLSNGNVLQTKPQIATNIPMLSNPIRHTIQPNRNIQAQPSMVTIGSTNTGTIQRPTSNVSYRPQTSIQQVQIVSNSNNLNQNSQIYTNQQINRQKVS